MSCFAAGELLPPPPVRSQGRQKSASVSTVHVSFAEPGETADTGSKVVLPLRASTPGRRKGKAVQVRAGSQFGSESAENEDGLEERAPS